jgi:cell division protease FtsH
MRTCKRIVLFCAVAVGGTLGWNALTRFQSTNLDISFSQFLNDVDSQQIASISIHGDEVVGVNTRTGRFRTYAPRGYVGFVNRVIDRNVDVSVVPEGAWLNRCAPWIVMFVLTQMWTLARVRSWSPGRA